MSNTSFLKTIVYEWVPVSLSSSVVNSDTSWWFLTLFIIIKSTTYLLSKQCACSSVVWQLLLSAMKSQPVQSALHPSSQVGRCMAACSGKLWSPGCLRQATVHVNGGLLIRDIKANQMQLEVLVLSALQHMTKFYPRRLYFYSTKKLLLSTRISKIYNFQNHDYGQHFSVPFMFWGLCCREGSSIWP